MKNTTLIWTLIALTLLICNEVQAQQKKETIYYDVNWKGVSTKEQSTFYRILMYNSDWVPFGEIVDYYTANDVIYSKITSAIKINKSDDSKSKYIRRMFYSSDGKVSKMSIYNKEGFIIEDYTFFDSGKVKSKSIFNNVQEIEKTTIYYESGSVFQECNYIKDTKDLDITAFNENGVKTTKTTYTGSVPKYDWYLGFDEKGDFTRYNIKTKLPYDKEKSKVYYKDGEKYQYYSQNGIGLTMSLRVEKNYGKYYVALICIANLTGTEFNFDPKDIKALLISEQIESDGIILSSGEYMKIINNRQGWQAALASFGQGIAASSAGYSSTASVSGATDGNNSAIGVGVSQSYSGIDNYNAQQNAERNNNNLKEKQYQIKKDLNQGYLKLNTIFNEERIVGQVNIVFKPASKIKITIPVAGVDYDFFWTIEN